MNPEDMPGYGEWRWKQYARRSIAEMRPYRPGEPLDHVSISASDKLAGSPVIGDMIARNPNNHDDQWLVSEKYFIENFDREPVGDCERWK